MDQNMGFRFPRLGFDSLWVYNKKAIAVATAFFVHRWDSGIQPMDWLATII